MAQYDQLTELLDLPNVRVIHYQRVGPNRLNLFVESTLVAALCPTCHAPSLVVPARDDARMIRDLPIWQRQCWVRYVPRRFDCATCQTTFVERGAWREAGALTRRATNRRCLNACDMRPSVKWLMTRT